MDVSTESVLTDRPSAATSAAAGRWRTAALAGVGVGLLILYVPTVGWLLDRWTMSVWHNAHGIFVAPLVAWLARRELRNRPDLAHDPGTGWGFLLLLPALALHALDAGIHSQLLSAISLVIALPGLSFLFLGWRRTKAIAFPLAFCAFALPIPLALTESMHLALRRVTAVATASILPVLGFPAYLEETTLYLTNGRLVIVDACSGFSTLYAALAVACLTAYTASSTYRRTVVLLVAAPLAIASNILRISVLSILVVKAGFGVLETFLHPLSGMLTFAISLPLILWLGGPVRRKDQARSDRS